MAHYAQCCGGVFKSNSGGSAIDPQFLENQKTAENSLSFGLDNVCYF
jgi:hypothetical protein